MPKGKWFDLRDLPSFIEQKCDITLKEFHFTSGGGKSNVELTLVNKITDKEMRRIIDNFIESKKKVGLKILEESDFCTDKKDTCFEFRYKNYSVLVVFTNDTEFKPRQVYIKCHKYPL